MSLKNHAARTIQFLGVSEANYKVAWESLQNHYEKIANLSVYYAGAFLELPAIKNKSSIAIREFIDDAKNHLRALEKLDEISWRNTMILVILMRKLDSIMLGEWRERALALKHNPTFKDFYQFLETRATYLEIYFRIINSDILTNNQQQCLIYN